MTGSIRFRTSAKLAWRDLRSAPRHSLLVLLMVCLSVAAVTGLHGAAGAFERALAEQERTGIAADLSVELHENPNPAGWQALKRVEEKGGRWTLVTSTIVMARSDRVPDPVAIVLRGVDPAVYPFYGELRLASGLSLKQGLTDSTAVASRDLLQALGLRVGETFAINGVNCRIAAALDSEPDRFVGNFSSSPRAIVTNEFLERTEVLRQDTPRLFRFLVALPSGASVIQMRNYLEQAFPTGAIFEASDSLNAGGDAETAAAGYLNITGWLAFVLGVAGVMAAAGLQVDSRLNTFAILRVLGISSGASYSWLVIELLLIGFGGGLGGAGLGIASRWLLLEAARVQPLAAAHLGRLTADGILIGIALSIAGGLAPITVAIRKRPAEILRGVAEERSSKRSSRLVFSIWMIFAITTGIFSGIGAWVPALVAALLATLIVFRSAARAVLWLLRTHSKRWIDSHGFPIRYALKTFPRSRVAELWLALAAFVAALVTAAAGGRSVVVQEIMRNLPLAQANLYLLGFNDFDSTGIRHILDRQTNIQRPYDIKNLLLLRVARYPGGGASLTPPLSIVGCSNGMRTDSGAQLDTGLARRLGVKLGGQLELDDSGTKFRVPITEIRDVPPTERHWFSLVIPCGVVTDSTLFHHAGIRIPEDDIPRLEHELHKRYPALAIVRPTDVFDGISKLIEKGAVLVEFLSIAMIAGGAILLGAFVAASSQLKSRETAILQALGARPPLITCIVVTELALMGAAGGIVGGLTGIGLMNVLLSLGLHRQVLAPRVELVGLAILSSTVLTVLTGLLAYLPLLLRRPGYSFRGFEALHD